jgi:hypothetical protein
MKANIILTTVITSCLSVAALASDFGGISEEVSVALTSGAIIMITTKPLNITPEIEEMIKQINSSKMVFEKPILIFSDDEIIVNDAKGLSETLGKSHPTVTSL